jgi:hypothetical protein
MTSILILKLRRK